MRCCKTQTISLLLIDAIKSISRSVGRSIKVESTRIVASRSDQITSDHIRPDQIKVGHRTPVRIRAMMMVAAMIKMLTMMMMMMITTVMIASVVPSISRHPSASEYESYHPTGRRRTARRVNPSHSQGRTKTQLHCHAFAVGVPDTG